MVMAPDHPLVARIATPAQRQVVSQFAAKTQAMRKVERTAEGTEKEGVFTGAYAVHPFSGEDLPIWVANFVLAEYGTGAVMAVPAHDARDFAFARKYHLPIKTVIRPASADRTEPPATEEAFVEDGVLINSDGFDGLRSEEARRQLVERLERQGRGKLAVLYRQKDWGISRQRYWGTPIPIIYCEKCGVVPVPENQLPVVLPDNIDITLQGGSPLGRVPEFVNVKCPKCDGAARRETDTMDTFVDSSWYFYRYTNPQLADRPLDTKAVDYWFPID